MQPTEGRNGAKYWQVADNGEGEKEPKEGGTQRNAGGAGDRKLLGVGRPRKVDAAKIRV